MIFELQNLWPIARVLLPAFEKNPRGGFLFIVLVALLLLAGLICCCVAKVLRNATSWFSYLVPAHEHEQALCSLRRAALASHKDCHRPFGEPCLEQPLVSKDSSCRVQIQITIER